MSSVENVELETDKRRFHKEMYFLLTINNRCAASSAARCDNVPSGVGQSLVVRATVGLQVRACVRACVRVCVHVCACVCVRARLVGVADGGELCLCVCVYIAP